jgi:Flavodoxin domain
MRALIVYESMYGNTRQVAEALAERLRDRCDVVVAAAHEAPPSLAGVDLLLVGGPTHMHGLATSLSRRMAAAAAKEDGTAVEPGATAARGLRTWLRGLPDGHDVDAAAFDTRGDAAAAITGSAARSIARRLRHRGFDVVGRESFLVADSEGPLEEGELERARTWAASLPYKEAGR